MDHVPVLLNEAVAALMVNPDGYYVDATHGAGGHSAAILERLTDSGRLLAIDRDPVAIEQARHRFGAEPRVAIRHGNFADLTRHVTSQRSSPVDGILLDLGVSSGQLDDAARGFSLMRDGPLDMRMNPNRGNSAAEWLAVAEEAEIAAVLWRYGEERQSRRIARAIVERRHREPLTRTGQLAALIAELVPRRRGSRVHPATRTFQAIRIMINSELAALEQALVAATALLAPGGRIVVITFHSLEDRMVKTFMRRWAGRLVPGDQRLPPPPGLAEPILTLVRGPKKPTADEVAENPRARSARLRVAQRTESALPGTYPGPLEHAGAPLSGESWHRRGVTMQTMAA